MGGTNNSLQHMGKSRVVMIVNNLAEPYGDLWCRIILTLKRLARHNKKGFIKVAISVIRVASSLLLDMGSRGPDASRRKVVSNRYPSNVGVKLNVTITDV